MLNLARIPTDAELILINKYVPKDYAKLTADEVGVVSLLVANNLLTYNYQKWAVDSLRAMPNLLIGRTATVNHDSWNVEKVFGKVFNASFSISKNPPSDIRSVNPYQSETNLAIVGREQYACVFADIYYRKGIDASAINMSYFTDTTGDTLSSSRNDATIDVPEIAALSAKVAMLESQIKEIGKMAIASTLEESSEDSVMQKIRFGQYDRVSLGSFDYSYLRCPDCTCEKGFELDGAEPCPLNYLPPMPYYGFEPDTTFSTWNGLTIKIAPYVIRDGLRNIEEVSFVVSGNNPFAATVK